MVMAEQETWRGIPGLEGLYEASNLGRIRSLRWSRPRILKQRKNKDGYMLTSIPSKLGVTALVNRLVCMAFYGKSDVDAAHIDHDRANNRLSNLAWLPHVANVGATVTAGRHARGDTFGRAKIRSSDLSDIFAALRAGIEQRRIGSWYGVKQATISLIALRKNWRSAMCVNTRDRAAMPGLS